MLFRSYSCARTPSPAAVRAPAARLSRLIFRRAFFVRLQSHSSPVLKTLGALARRPEHFKVQVVMQRATRIEPRSARRTSRLTIQVLKDGQLSAACAAQNRLLIEFSLRSSAGRMTGFQFVTVEAGIIRPAAVEFDSNDVQLTTIMRATGAPIYLDSSYRYS